MPRIGICNPVYEPVFADPTVIIDEGMLYAFATADDQGDGRGLRLIPIMRSRNGQAWEDVGDAFTDRPAWIPAEAGIWAPDISSKNGRYLLFYSMAVWGDHEIPAIGVASSDRPTGPFTDHGPVLRSMEIGVFNSIDPMHFFDDDSHSYLIWGSFNGIYGVALDNEGLRVAGNKFQIAGDAFEAAHVIKRNGWYYLLGSKGTCCDGELSTYRVCVGRSEQLQGPYIDRDGITLMDNGGTLVLQGDIDGTSAPKIVGPGHHSIFTDLDGQDWIVYHGIDASNPYLPNRAPRRPLFIDPITWHEGWPLVKDMKPNLADQPGPAITNNGQEMSR